MILKCKQITTILAIIDSRLCLAPPSLLKCFGLRQQNSPWSVRIGNFKRSLGQGNVFTLVCDSAHRGCTPPEQTPPGQTTPGRQPPLGRYPLGSHPLGRHPHADTSKADAPWADTPYRQTSHP